MKCSKCKYTTFDYADTCPRCGKDISGEKAKLHILAIKPNTPFLLGSLTGDLGDSSAAFVVPEAVKDPSESMSSDTGDIYDDGSELSINIDEEPVVESEAADVGDLSSADTDQEMEMELDSEQMPEDIGELGGAKEAGSDIDEGEAQQEVSERKATGEDEPYDLEIEDLDLKLEMSEDEESDT